MFSFILMPSQQFHYRAQEESETYSCGNFSWEAGKTQFLVIIQTTLNSIMQI